jgi:HAD superfamily hydrolase (TIGR01509 family)
MLFWQLAQAALYNMPLKALIFDVDGTLAETEAAHLRAFNQVFTAAGLDWHWSESLYLDLLKVTGGKERIAHYLQQHRSDFSHPDLSGFIANLHQRKTADYIKLIAAGGVPLRTGVKRLLDEAKAANIRLAIATTTSRQNIHALIDSNLGHGSTEQLFEVISAGEDVKNKKPAGDVYANALAQLQLAAEDCIAIEDSLNGLLSASAEHIPTVITRSPYSPMLNFHAAKLVLDHLGEPTQAMHVEQGNPYGHQYVSITLLQKIAENR